MEETFIEGNDSQLGWGNFSHQGANHPCLGTFLIVKLWAPREALLSSK